MFGPLIWTPLIGDGMSDRRTIPHSGSAATAAETSQTASDSSMLGTGVGQLERGGASTARSCP